MAVCSACNSNGTDVNVTNVTAGSTVDEFGCPDADTLGFRSCHKTLDIGDGYNIHRAYDIEGTGNFFVLADKWNKETEMSAYKIILLDKETCEKVNEFEVDYQIWAICDIDDRYLAICNSSGYGIVDLSDGHLVYSGNGEERIRPERQPVLGKCEGGFLYADDETISRISVTGEVLDKIQRGELGNPLPYGSSTVIQNGNLYVFAEDDSSMGIGHYYKINLELGTVTDVAKLDETDEISGAVYRDSYRGDVCEFIIEEQRSVPVSYQRNMLISPVNGYAPEYFILDKYHYVIIDTSTSGSTDITTLYADETMDLANRTPVRIVGDYATGDLGLRLAAYQFNIEQDEYLVSVEAWGAGDDWDTAKSAEARDLRLLKRFQSGDAPDIIYGNTFDFNYLGKAGVVIDMMPYVESSSVVSQNVLVPSVYDAFTRDGHCYALADAFKMSGVFGDTELMGDKAGDYKLYGDKGFNEATRGRFGAIDILYNIYGIPASSFMNSPDFITEKNLEESLKYAVANGLSPAEIDAKGYSLSVNPKSAYTSINTLPDLVKTSVHCKGAFGYYGYPSTCGVSHPMEVTGLAAISAGTSHPDVCFKVLEKMYSYDIQKEILYNRSFPVNKKVMDEYVSYMVSPQTIPSGDKRMKSLAADLFYVPGRNSEEAVNDGGNVKAEYREITPEVLESFNKMIDSIDSVQVVHFGIYNILTDELNSYYLQDKPVPEIAKSMYSRLMLYLEENG